MKSILDSSFRYTPSVETDVRKTFERIRRELQSRAGQPDLDRVGELTRRVGQDEGGRRRACGTGAVGFTLTDDPTVEQELDRDPHDGRPWGGDRR